MNQTKTLPVEKWYVRLNDPIVDDGAALDGWVSLVRAHGWSPVGEPEIMRDPVNPGVIGKVVRYPGLDIDPSIGSAIKVPA